MKRPRPRSISSGPPNHQSIKTLKSRWSGLPCRKAEVTRRHHSPWATAGPNRAPFTKSEPPSSLMPPDCPIWAA